MLKSTFPNLKDWNPTDPLYHPVLFDEIQYLITAHPQPLWKQYKWECEEIAKGWMMDIRRWEYDNELTIYNRAIGVANATKIFGQKINHTLNIAVTEEGLMLIDAATGGSWPARKGQDDIYFVEM